MPIEQPTGSALWQAVSGSVKWPVSNEDAATNLGDLWTMVGERFKESAKPIEGFDQAWPDDVGRAYKKTIDDLQLETARHGSDALFLGTLASAYGEDVKYAKQEIVRTIAYNEGAYLGRQRQFKGAEFAGQVAAVLNYFLEQMASRIAFRSTRGPRQPNPEVLHPAVGPPVLEGTAKTGADRERRVAEISGGTVLGEPGKEGLIIRDQTLGQTDVDVLGPDGELIAVGGNAKYNDPHFADSLRILQAAATRRGVPAEAYFDTGTRPEVIRIAIGILGKDNVHIIT